MRNLSSLKILNVGYNELPKEIYNQTNLTGIKYL